MGAKVTKGSILTITCSPNEPTLKTIFKARVDGLENISNPATTTTFSDEQYDGGIKLTITEILEANREDFKEGNKVYLVNLPEGSDFLHDDSPSRIIIKSTNYKLPDKPYSSVHGIALVTNVGVGAEDVTSGGYKHRKNKRSVRRRRTSKRSNIRRKNKNKKVTKRMRKSRRRARR